MISFESDYTEGAHPLVLEALVKTNLETLVSYGNDKYCASAKEKIKSACGLPDADVYFLTGGTQTNKIVISSLLESYEGVVAADTGHISSHEAGAIEFSGHKVLTIPHDNGKINGDDLDALVEGFYADANHEHMVFPGMVYISHPTEYGTLYTLDELTRLSEICRKHSMPLYLDGARLGYGIMSNNTDVSLRDIARLCDIFYIGGTKVGAVCGEAVVFTKGNMPHHFPTIVKQNGAMLAKGRLLGVQFDALFSDGLYEKIGAHGIEMAEKLKKLFVSKGIPFHIDSPTNQQFVILDDSFAAKLREKVKFSTWEALADGKSAYRFVTSWATRSEDIDALAELL